MRDLFRAWRDTVIKIIDRRGEDDLTASINAVSWEGATSALLNAYRFQPDGYTLIAAKIVRRGSRGGKRCQVRLTFRRTNQRSPVITDAEAGDLFATELRLASLKEAALDEVLS